MARNRRNRKRNPRKRRRQAQGLASFKKGSALNVNRQQAVQNYRPSIVFNRFSNGFPDEYFVNLVYICNANASSQTAQVAVFFEGNNPWDPDPQLGGESAREYAFFQNIYQYCRVYGSSILAEISIVNQQPFTTAIVPKTDNAGVAYTQLASMPRAKFSKYLQVGGITSCRLSNSCNTASLFGVPSIDFDLDHRFDIDNTIGSGTPVEPLEKWYWCVYFSSIASQTMINASATIRITYKCHFYKKKYLPTLQSVADDGDDELEPMVEGIVKMVNPDPPEPL